MSPWAQAVDHYVEHGSVLASKTVFSQFKGVSWSKSCNMWQARCEVGAYTRPDFSST